jgi:phage baseplate assembly protein W
VTGLGSAPFGSSRFGGAGELVIRGAVAIGLHEVLVDFDRRPMALDRGAYDSATNPRNWAITPVDPTLGGAPPRSPVPTRELAVIGVDYDDFTAPTQVIVATDLAMEPQVFYDITAQPLIKGAACEDLVDRVTWRVLARRAPRAAALPSAYYVDRYRDLHITADGVVQDPNGDIALHGGLEALRKRVLRRVTTALGSFAMLPDYGTELRIKSTIRRGDLQALANTVTSQVMQEPDVLRASAVVRLMAAGVVLVDVSVTRRDNLDQTFYFDFPVGGAA